MDQAPTAYLLDKSPLALRVTATLCSNVVCRARFARSVVVVAVVVVVVVVDRVFDLVWREVFSTLVLLVPTRSSTSTGPVGCSLSLLWSICPCFVLFLLSNRLACDFFGQPHLRLARAFACGGVAVSLAIVIVLVMKDTKKLGCCFGRFVIHALKEKPRGENPKHPTGKEVLSLW